ncbi:hypothetical protein PV797_20160 [Clostridiaceae bacterium M8S5]|nr:hypothetical protein PV797_20160 [Clostridiaceae bacterium M8S5]
MEYKGVRATEMVLGIIGGALGIVGGILAFFIGGFGALLIGTSGKLAKNSLSAFGFSIIAIIASLMVHVNPKLAGWGQVITGVALIISISIFGFIPGVLLIIAGAITLRK